jgi:polyisoprenoid-binding protein YceI
MKKSILTFGLLSAILISCNNTETPKTEVVETVEVCTYKYSADSTVIGWTAFKFTEKKGVSGVFDQSEVLIANTSEDMLQTLAGASFTIPVSSINSQNPVRDTKLKNSFFGVMESTEIISGIVKSISDSEALVEITMNGVSKDYTGTVTTDGLKVSFSTTINMTDFEAQYAVDSLNIVCSDVHTGADGISKLWSEVDINVETILVKTCK